MNEHELITRVKLKDEEAYTILIDTYKDQLANYIYRIVWDEEMAKDLVQDTFIKVFLNIDKYEYITKFKTWLYTIATNLSINQWRRMKKRRILSLQALAENNITAEVEETISKPASECPLGTLLAKERRQIIKNALSTLKPKYKIPIVLFDFEQQSYESISEILNIPIGTVKSRIHRARVLLKKKLEPYMDFNMEYHEEDTKKQWIAAR
jgi:RNA polymerase sigma-70 factor (ECF subfamily)